MSYDDLQTASVIRQSLYLEPDRSIGRFGKAVFLPLVRAVIARRKSLTGGLFV